MERLPKYPGRTSGPFRNVIVGVDEHHGGRDATALAKGLMATGGSLILAHVYIRHSLSGRGSRPDFEAVERRRALERHPAAEYDVSGDAELRCVESPSVGRGLHELAGAERADLLVVGSLRRGLIGRVTLGDATSDALNGAPCAVAIAPFGYAERPAVLGEIGVAYDGSPESENALAVARALAAEHGARLSAFEAVSVPAFLNLPGAGAVVEPLPALVEQARARIAALGGVEPHAAYGVPAEELAMYGASLDLLVVGSRGYGPVGRLVHGSTSRRLARTARCPLLVLTRAARVIQEPDLNQAGRATSIAAAD
jgi:nucleotide-binding universal stress UspA family protein